MKKIYTLTLALLATITVNAQSTGQTYLPNQHDNLVTVVADDATDELDMYPLNITLTNPSIPMCGVEAYLQIDDNSVRPWVYDEDDENYVFDRNKSRTYSSLKFAIFPCAEDNPNHSGQLYVNFVDAKDFKLSEGTIATVYFDATQLSNGDHTIHVISPMCSYVGADLSSASYFCHDQEIHFTLSNGTLTVLNNINIIAPQNTNTATYDLHGRKVNVNAHGLYLQNGNKIIR